MLSLFESLTFLKKEKISIVKTIKISKKEELQKIKKFPVVLKIDSSEITHKTDVNGVILNIKNKEELLNAYNKLKKITEQVVVQPMIKGTEIIIGVKKDPVFEQVILFGSGGILAELFNDFSLRVCPINKKEALKMIKETRIYKILKGYRRQTKINVNELINLLVRISELAVKYDVKEMDLNPVICTEKDCFIVDARFEFKKKLKNNSP